MKGFLFNAKGAENMIRVSYIYHSCYMVEMDNSILIFDYWKGDLPKELLSTSKNLLFFCSHVHLDHFNPEIFKYNSENVYYILSKDIQKYAMHKGLMDGYDNLKLSYINAYDKLQINGLIIKTIKSTDRGVAYIVEENGKTIFHSGDFYNWYLESQDKAKRNDMEARYLRELEKLKDYKLDAAFVPLDPRLGVYYGRGMKQFMDKVNVAKIFPMHMWEEYQYIHIFKESYGGDNLMDLSREGETWDI